MTEQAINTVKKQLKKVEQLVIRLGIIYFVIGVIGFFIPVGLLPKAGGRVHGRITEPLPEQIGVVNYVLLMFIICAILCGIVFYYNKYFDLKKDMQEQREIKISVIINKLMLGNNDFGKPVCKIWLSQNKYEINTLHIPLELDYANELAKGQEVEFILTANAYLPIKINILTRRGTDLTKKNVDEFLKKINQIKNKKDT